MKSRKPRLGSVDEKVPTLIKTLVKTEQRRDKLAPGQVAVVGDSEARAPLLRGTGEQLPHNEATSQAAIRNALPAHIALLDSSGVILFVNGAWREFGGANALQGSGSGVGLNYLEICDHAREISSSEAPLVAEGIRSVLDGRKKSFSSEYPCHWLAGQRWFQLVVTPLHDDGLLGVVVMHLDISERKQVERSAQLNQKRLRDLIDGLGPSIFVGLMTPQGILIEVNRPALAAAGLEPQDVLGKPWRTPTGGPIHLKSNSNCVRPSCRLPAGRSPATTSNCAWRMASLLMSISPCNLCTTRLARSCF